MDVVVVEAAVVVIVGLEVVVVEAVVVVGVGELSVVSFNTILAT